MTKHNDTLSRRTFLATATATATGLALATSSYGTPTRRTGLIGYGESGAALFRQAADPTLPLQITTVADSDGTRLAQLPREITRRATWESLLADTALDAIIVATPDYLHAPIALAALEAGKHVYLLPPFAHTTEAAQSLVQAAHRAPGTLHLAQDTGLRAHWKQALQPFNDSDDLRWIQADIPLSVDRPAHHWSHRASQSRGDASCALFSALYPLALQLGLKAPRQSTLFGGVFDTAPRETPDALALSSQYENGLQITFATRAPGVKQRHTVIRSGATSLEVAPPLATPQFDLHDWMETIQHGTNTHHLEVALTTQQFLCDAHERMV
jgi:predicted dehydrogenase